MLATYEYQCTQCHSVFELRRDWNTVRAIVNCPICQSADVQRLFSPVMMMGHGTHASAWAIGLCGSCSRTSCGSCAFAKHRQA